MNTLPQARTAFDEAVMDFVDALGYDSSQLDIPALERIVTAAYSAIGDEV